MVEVDVAGLQQGRYRLAGEGLTDRHQVDGRGHLWIAPRLVVPQA
jgi:hypothetical protein